MRAYEQSDFFVFPTQHEGFPRVLYEAMIKSTLVFTTMVGGIPGLMQPDKNCIAIPGGSASAIADAIVQTSSKPAHMQRIVDAALDTVIDVLTKHPTHLLALRKELDA